MSHNLLILSFNNEYFLQAAAERDATGVLQANDTDINAGEFRVSYATFILSLRLIHYPFTYLLMNFPFNSLNSLLLQATAEPDATAVLDINAINIRECRV